MSLLAIALLIFAQPIEIDWNNPRFVETDVVLIVNGEELVAQQLSARTVDGTYVTIAIKYPHMLHCPMGIPCGETIVNSTDFYDVDRLINYIRDRYSDYYIGFQSLQTLDGN